MTTETIQLTEICAGGGHLTFTYSGEWAGTFRTTIDAMDEALSQEDREAFFRVICWFAKNGRTRVQARNLLQAGVTITV